MDIVIGSQIGEHMEEALRGRGLKYYERTGTAKDAAALLLTPGKKKGE